MKLLLPHLLLLAAAAPAAQIAGAAGDPVRAITYEPDYQLVQPGDAPESDSLPGMRHYVELRIAHAVGDEEFFQRFTYRATASRINLGLPESVDARNWERLETMAAHLGRAWAAELWLWMSLGVGLLGLVGLPAVERPPAMNSRWPAAMREAAPVLAIATALMIFCAAWGAIGGAL
jgi:hypothetical protein